jgi:hypothetical protein
MHNRITSAFLTLFWAMGMALVLAMLAIDSIYTRITNDKETQ